MKKLILLMLLSMATQVNSYAQEDHESDIALDEGYLESENAVEDFSFAIESVFAEKLGSFESSDPNQQDFKIIGRGIENKQTGDSVALACVGQVIQSNESSCKELQFIYYVAKTRKVIKMWNKKIELPQEPSKSDLKKLMKSIAKNYKEYRKRATYSKRYKVGLYVFLATGAIAATMPIGLAALVVPVLAVGLSDLALMKKAVVTKSFINQNGWNWGLKPIRYNDKHFNFYINSLSLYMNNGWIMTGDQNAISIKN